MNNLSSNYPNSSQPTADQPISLELPLQSAPFRVIYVEQAAESFPLTQSILAKFPTCQKISIQNYKEIFNRPRQNLQLQKQHPALILAVKEPPFIYPGPDICQNFGQTSFYYTSFLLNCPFDCEYCYLQGMYPSANLVAFVNIEDFKAAITESISLSHQHDPRDSGVLLAASYDTDLMAFNHVFPYLDNLYPFLSMQNNLTVEIRTKSADRSFYTKREPIKSLIFAYTLAPDQVINKYEKYTPSLASRLLAIVEALEQGFRVRLCFDPIFIEEDLSSVYEPFFHQVFDAIDPQYIHSGQLQDVSYGFFRMNQAFFRRIAKKRPASGLFLQDFSRLSLSPGEDMVTYEEALRQHTQELHLSIISQYIQKERIYTI